MGVMLSRLMRALLQVEYRRWFYGYFMFRSQRNNAQNVLTENVSTQTPCIFTIDTRIDISTEDTLSGEPSVDAAKFAGEYDRSNTPHDYPGSDSSYARRSRPEESMKSSNRESCEYSDICIFENPDFSQFGRLYEHLASPRDRSFGLRTPTRVLRIPSLSAISEETGDVDSTTAGGGGGHQDTPCPQFGVDADDKETQRDYCGHGHGSGGVPCKTALSCSLSSDSGIGEGLCRSHNSSLSDMSGGETWDRTHCATSTSTDSGIDDERKRLSNTSVSDGTCSSSSRLPDFDLDVRSSDLGYVTHDQCRDHADCCETAVDDVFKNENIPSTFVDRTEIGDPTTDSLKEALTDHHQKSQRPYPTKQRSSLTPLTIGARLRVLFSEDGLGATSPPVSSSSSSPISTSSSAFERSTHPAFDRQDSGESTTSMSSREDALAAPFSPDTPDSPMFFPGLQRHYFSEPDEGRDLILIAEGESFHVHSSVLARQCRSLCMHLRRTESREVVLFDKRADHVLTFLYLLYRFEDQVITASNVEGVLNLAHHLGCHRVISTCSSYLIGLAAFPDLCPHGHRRLSHGRVQDLRSAFCVTSLTSDTTDSTTNTTSPDRNKCLGGRTQAQTMQGADTWCTCAETLTDRVVDILLMSVKYDLQDVYCEYVNVGAGIRTDELRAGARYGDLSAATREDILQTRIRRLESVVHNFRVTESFLTSCSNSRHHR